MITNVQIEGFKAIDKASLLFKPITILTGTNSSGKSSTLQAILYFHHFHCREVLKVETIFSDLIQPMAHIRNKNTNAREVIIQLDIEKENEIELCTLSLKDEKHREPSISQTGEFVVLYLSSSRQDLKQITSVKYSEDIRYQSLSYLGNHTSSLLHEFMSNVVSSNRCYFDESNTLKYQVDQWVSKILQQEVRTETQYIESAELVLLTYIMNNISDIPPESVGSGQNHLIHILVMCLLANEGHVVIIENPELHLHPKAQSILSEFFTMIANAGIQVIIETHSEHIIHKFCHEVYQENLDRNDIIIHYKDSVEQDFESICINKRGHYSDQEGNRIMFPSGFFDATLSEILEVS